MYKVVTSSSCDKGGKNIDVGDGNGLEYVCRNVENGTSDENTIRKSLR